MNIKVLIADDDPQQRRYLSAVLAALGYQVATASGGVEAVEMLQAAQKTAIGAVLLDLHMPDLDGLGVLRKLRESGVSLPVLVLTSDGSVSRAVEAMRAGAVDFLVKPVAPERVDVSLRNALAIKALSREVSRLSRREENRLSFEDLVAVSPATRKVIALARRVSRSDLPVLIEGESGTGKEVFSRAIHGSSERAGAAFVAVNCGALPAALIESILFGHEKGAFTGATERRRGRFQEASGGTLFLDEIGELPLDAQVKLLRAVQSGEVDPVGRTGPVKVNCRLICATNRDLRAMVAAGQFREDLYYRISVFPLSLPPLRERREDLPGLANMFLAQFSSEAGSTIEGFSSEALVEISRAPWPGNVRQLQNAIQRAVIMSDGVRIRPGDLHGLEPDQPVSARLEANAGAPAPETADQFMTQDGQIRRLIDIEAVGISLELTLYRGSLSEIARRMGIGRSSLYR
jgi:DNA-binding NtrC family response regulator